MQTVTCIWHPLSQFLPKELVLLKEKTKKRFSAALNLNVNDKLALHIWKWYYANHFTVKSDHFSFKESSKRHMVKQLESTLLKNRAAIQAFMEMYMPASYIGRHPLAHEVRFKCRDEVLIQEFMLNYLKELCWRRDRVAISWCNKDLNFFLLNAMTW